MASSADILTRLFNSASRVKIIRLFLLNPGEVLPHAAICRRAKVSRTSGRREIALLKTIGFIRSKSDYFATTVKNKRGKPRKKRISGWKLDETFPLMLGLKNFILDTVPISRDQLLKKLQRAGRLKLVILAGIFGEENSSRVDILAVGDGLKRGVLERVIKEIEAEVGKELTYAAFSTQDFLYRLGMYDKFIRDILDYPHEKILNKLGI